MRSILSFNAKFLEQKIDSSTTRLVHLYEIIHKAKKDFEQAVTKEPEIKPTQKVISEKESEIATSVETQVESQDKIESRLYSFALNFLFKYQDPGEKILRSELIKTMDDYIEHFSLKYSDVQKLADKAISEFREKSRTTPEFKTAYQELYKTGEKTTEEQEIDSVLSSKIDTRSEVRHVETLPQGTITKKYKIDENHIFILKNIRHVEYPALLIDSFIQKMKKSRATFFRKVDQLERWGLIVHVNKRTPRHYRLSPKLLNSSLKFLVVGEGTSLTFESTSQTVPIVENPDVNQFSKSHSYVPSVSISAAAETEPCTNETEPKSTNKIAPLSEKREEEKDLAMDPRASSVSTSPNSEKLREKYETEQETTRKIPSFEELIAKFDPHNIRSHDYLYICEIKRAPKDFRLQLADSNWLESKEGMNNWTWYRGVLKLHNIQCHYHIYTRKVTIQLLEVSSPDPFANNAIADDIAVQVTAYLEDQFPGLVLYDLKRRSRLKVKKLHHAIPNHPIAIRAFELSYTSTGTRFGVDDSKGNKEIEAHNHKYSTEDIDNYIEDCDFKAENDYWFRNSAQDIRQNGEILRTTTKIQKEAAEIQEQAAKQIEEVSRNQLWSISGQRHQTEIQQSFINGSMHLIEQNLALQERVENLEQQLPKIPKTEDFTKETEMFDPSRTLVEKLQLILEKNPGITREQVIKHFGFKKGSIGPTIGRLAKRVNLREKNRRLFIIDSV